MINFGSNLQSVLPIAYREKIGKRESIKFEYLENEKSCLDKINILFDNLLSVIFDEINESRRHKL